MPEEPPPPSPETQPPGVGQRAGTGLAGESTRSMSAGGTPGNASPSALPGPALPISEIIGDFARGLQYGWQNAQLVHRDIKPGNIFLSHEGTVKLGDLGLAKLLDSSTTGLTQTGTMMGTPHYISPEQARGDREIDFRADI